MINREKKNSDIGLDLLANPSKKKKSLTNNNITLDITQNNQPSHEEIIEEDDISEVVEDNFNNDRLHKSYS